MASKKSGDKTRRQTELEIEAEREARLEAFRKKTAALRATQKAREKKRRGPRLRKTPEYAQAQYAERLKIVRKYVAGFDAKELAPKAMARVPESAEAKRKRRNERARVNRAFKKLKPYITRPQKTVKVASKRKREALRDYSGVPRIKGLKAVPVPTIDPKKAKVKVDRKGRVSVAVGDFYEKEFLFPRKPKSPDDVEAMADELLRKLPAGTYVLITNVRELLPTSASRSQLMSQVRRFLLNYNSSSPGLVTSLRGFKLLGATTNAALKRMRKIADARQEAREMRANVWQDVAKQAAEFRKKKRRASKRERLTGKR